VDRCDNNAVLVCVVQEEPAPGLGRLALRNGWTLARCESAATALFAIRRRRPEIAVLQVSLRADESLELIRMLWCDPPTSVVIAAARGHHETLERAIRHAGVCCYLPDADDLDAVEDAVLTLLRQRESASMQTARNQPAHPQKNSDAFAERALSGPARLPQATRARFKE
jgi:DNA-binding NarL/FixJ family response regulator